MASFRQEENAEWCNKVSTETPQGFWKKFDMKNKNTTSFFFFLFWWWGGWQQGNKAKVTIVIKPCTKHIECSFLKQKKHSPWNLIQLFQSL